MADLTDFIDGLEALTIAGVTMLGEEPAEAPKDSALPVAWVERPTLIGQPSQTWQNSVARPYQYRAALVVAAALSRQDRIRDHRDDLMTIGLNVASALDSAAFDFRLSYELAVEAKIDAAGTTFFGVAAVVTGER